MTLWQYWLLGAVLIFVAELFSGTFYLLVLAAALAGTSLYTFVFNASLNAGLLVAALLSAIGIIAIFPVRHSKKALPPEDDFDIGATVQLEQPLSNGLWRVFYRGTTWEARAVSGSQFQMGDTAVICGKDGITLLINSH